ncbi:MAG: hypothetical protein ACRD6U_06405 [Nitrososphaeraceae archaeon]
MVYTDGGTWFPQACNFLHLKHYLHSPIEKSLIERVMQYFKDRTESFDDTILVLRITIVIYNMYTIGKDYLFIYLYNARIRNTILFKNGGEVVLS